ncbi:MAG: hypothetical protein LBM96_08095 [Methanobrevibacter sp.]|jgi:hypothetical protein|nr:hypothetical protein [Candidatus Methanoflexus mossambicus]
MEINEVREIIEKSDLFRRENDDYIKTYEYTVDVLINRGFKYYNIQKIDMKEDEMILYSTPRMREEIIKYDEIEEMYMDNFII